MEQTELERASDTWERVQLLAIVVAVVGMAASLAIRHPVGPMLDVNLVVIRFQGDLVRALPVAGLVLLLVATVCKHHVAGGSRAARR